MSEPRTSAPLGRREAAVVATEDVGAYRVVRVADTQGPAGPRPGQFYMVSAREGWGGREDGRPFLPRAFSFSRVRAAGHGAEVEILFEAVGPGTAALAELAPSDGVWLAGPFGVGFRPAASGRSLLVGGGIGVAPLLCWHEELERAGAEHAVLLGFRDSLHAPAAELFGESSAVATDDGSVGRHGYVTDLLREALGEDRAVTVFACGPPPMLETVRALCAEHEVPAQLAMEAGMACGYGACFGCVVPTRGGYVRLCLDGPVLDGDALDTALAAHT